MKAKITITISIACTALILTMIMFTQFKTVDETDITELRTELASWKEKYEDVESKIEETNAKIDEYKKELDNDANTAELLQNEIKEAESYLGYNSLQGQGVIITLKDTSEATYSADDLLMLVNELKYAGAEAISINDNRIINLTDIISINNSFIVVNSDARISSPFVVKAIGDKDYLMSTLNLKNSGFVDLMRINNLEVEVESSDNVIIYKYSKYINAEFMKEVE